MGLRFFPLHRLPPLLPHAISISISISSSSPLLAHSRRASRLLGSSSPPLPPFASLSAFPLSSSSSDANYLSLSDKALFAQCEMGTFRGSGPGGQHRNKTESAVRLKHVPTGLVAQACNDRSQHKNRADALERLRRLIATKVRRHVDLAFYTPPPELIRILPVAKGHNKVVQPIGPKHPEFLQGLQALLDVLYASEGYIQVAAWVLRVSTGELSKVFTSEKFVLEATNEVRVSKGLKALR